MRPILFFACFCLIAACATDRAFAQEVRGHYECDWWSVEQMNGLDPNHPPPKTTRVRLDRWEYSDPVGVPHPDRVVLVLELTAQSDALVALEVKTSWRTKSWSREKRAAAREVRLAANQPATVKIDIAVEPTIDRTYPRMMRSIIYIDGRRKGAVDLPIVLGD